MSGVKYESNPLPLNRDHQVSAGTIRFHFDVPTPKVTVSRRNQARIRKRDSSRLRWTKNCRQVVNRRSFAIDGIVALLNPRQSRAA